MRLDMQYYADNTASLLADEIVTTEASYVTFQPIVLVLLCHGIFRFIR
jgi:hypothetical protein